MPPHSCVFNVIAVSPEPGVNILDLLDPVLHQTVVLPEVVDLHQPAPVQLTFTPGVLPVVSYIGKQILVTRLKKLLEFY